MRYKSTGSMAAAILLAAAVAPAVAQEQVIVATNDNAGVVVRSADLTGRVFILSQGEEDKGAPADKVRVQVRDVETDELLAETFTDRDGAYELPRFDIGRYHLVIGALQLNMEVVPESEEAMELAKVVIVILPEEMARGGRPATRRR